MNQEELRKQLLHIIDSGLNARAIAKYTNIISSGSWLKINSSLHFLLKLLLIIQQPLNKVKRFNTVVRGA